MAELLDKEQAYRDKDSEAGDEEMVSESSDINEDHTETASEISEHQESENPDLEPEGNSEISLKGTESSLLLLQRRERVRKSSSQMP